MAVEEGVVAVEEEGKGMTVGREEALLGNCSSR
jgi:hypothetical protein